MEAVVREDERFALNDIITTVLTVLIILPPVQLLFLARLNMKYLFIPTIVATGASAFFFQAAVPHQEGPKIPAAAGLLDNPAVAADSNITPSRKCGFCMG